MERRVFLVAAMVWVTAPLVAAQVAGQSAGPFDGRWVIEEDAWFDQNAGAATTAARQGGRGGRAGAAGAAAQAGRGGGRGAQAPAQDVILELQLTPSGGVAGRATGISGRRGAPGSHPAHDIEITRGASDGGVLRFEIWRFDGYHNRVHVTARPSADGLDLEFRRDAPAGPETFTTRARRAPR